MWGGSAIPLALLPLTLAQTDPTQTALLLCVAAAVAWYIASYAAADAARSASGSITLGIVVGGALPVTIAAVAAALGGMTLAALSLAVGAAVAAVTLVFGLVSTTRTVKGKPEDWQGTGGKSRGMAAGGRPVDLAMLLPVAVTLLLAGFAGYISGYQALLFLAEGAIVAWMLTRGRAEAGGEGVVEEAKARPARAPTWAAGVQLVMAAVLSAAATGLAFAATEAAGGFFGQRVDALFASVLFAAVLLLPLIGIGTVAAADGNRLAVQRGLVMLAAILLTTCLPAVVLIAGVQEARAMVSEEAASVAMSAASGDVGGAPVWRQLIERPPGMALPLRIWRVDAVLLCVVGLLFLPAAAGRFRMGRIEGVGLIMAYAIYLVLSVLMSR